MVGEKVIIHYGDSADDLNHEVEIDPTIATFNLDEYISSIEDEIPPLMEGIVDSITVNNLNPDFYFRIMIIRYNGEWSVDEFRNYSRTINVKELELRVGEKILLNYFDKDDKSQEIELDLTKEVFDFDEHFGYDPSEKLTVVSTTTAAKATQFYLNC